MTKLKNPGFFKGERSTGLAACANPYPTTYITMGRGGKVGAISPPSATSLGGHDHWRIGLMIKVEPTKEKPAPFKWVYFKKDFETEEEARAAIRKDWEAINKKFDLYESER